MREVYPQIRHLAMVRFPEHGKRPRRKTDGVPPTSGDDVSSAPGVAAQLSERPFKISNRLKTATCRGFADVHLVSRFGFLNEAAVRKIGHRTAQSRETQ
jgi:hypothetical protein